MALRNIVYEDNPMIRKKSRFVEDFDEKLWDLLDDMKETMIKNEGCGIAAPQVGVLKQVVIIDAENMFFELINPKIISSCGSQESIEGCLSVKNHNGLVIRPLTVTVEFYNRYGSLIKITVSDFLATVFCHEIDHLSGVLFVDKAKELYKKDEFVKRKQKDSK